MAFQSFTLCLLLLIVGAAAAGAAPTESIAQSNRRLLTTTTTTIPVQWGSHHSGELCYVDNVLGSIVKPLLRTLEVYVKADVGVLCINVGYVDLAGAVPLEAVAFLGLKKTNYCSSLVNVNLLVKLDINGNLVTDILGTVGDTAEEITSVLGIWGDNGTGALLALCVTTNKGKTTWFGNKSSVGLQLVLNVPTGLIGFQSKFCTVNGIVSYCEFLP